MSEREFSLPIDAADADEQITAGVQADIERNTALLLKDYPLASITPIIDGLKHFPPSTAHPVRSWPVKAAPSPLPTFSNDYAEGIVLIRKPLDDLSQSERGYVERNLENVTAVVRHTLLQQPIEELRFKDVTRHVPENTAVPNVKISDRPRRAIDELLDNVPIPHPGPASGRSIAGQPVASSSRQLLESMIHSALPNEPHINGHSHVTPQQTPQSSHKRKFSNVNGSSPSFYVDVSPQSVKKRQQARVAAQEAQMDVEEPAQPLAPASSQQPVVSDQGQTAVRKLSAFLEEVFEAEDSFSATDVRLHPSLNAALFFPSNIENDPPLLSPIAIRHTLKLVRHVVKLNVLLDVRSDDLARLLKIIERSVRRGEEIEAIPAQFKGRSHVMQETPSKKKGAKASSKASTPVKTPAKRPSRIRKAAAKSGSPLVDDEESDELAEDPDDQEDFKPGQESQRSRKSQATSRASRSPSETRGQPEMLPEDKPTLWSDEQLERFDSDLRVISEALMASELALAILTGASLPKQFYAEELVSSIVNTVKAQLDSLVYPCIQAAADIENGWASNLAHPLRVAPSSALLADVFRNVADVVPLATELMRLEEMSESIIVNCVVIAIGPFFVDTPTQAPASAKKGKAKDLFGAVTLRTIQLPALSLLRNIFAKYPDQRSWIVEEIVNSLTKLSDVKKAKRQFRLRNGAAIHNVSALLLHLVQSTAYGVEETVRKQLMRDEPEDEENLQTKLTATRVTAASRTIVKASIESASVVANSLVKLLLERSKSAAKSSSDGDYRAVFENLLADVLIVIDLPEWPVANFMLQICLRRMLGAMDAKQASPEASALKALAVEHLGNIGSKLCERAMLSKESDSAALQPLSKILQSGDEAELTRLMEAQFSVIAKLHEWTTEDGVSETAAQFMAARYASDLLRAIDKITLESDEPSESQEKMPLEGNDIEKLRPHLEEALRKLFADRRSHLDLTPGLEDDDGSSPSLHAISMSLAWAQGQSDAFESLLTRILDVLHTSEAAGQRSKCLKALGKVVEKDPSIFARDDVRYAIEQRFKDTQPSVRDAAFDLLGGYVVKDADLAAKYLPRIADRITDTGLSVRKRVIKLLRSIYTLLPDEQQQVEICRRLLSRTKDDDDGIKNLAMTAMEEIWFEQPSSPRKAASKVKKAPDSDDEGPSSTSAAKFALLTKSRVLVSLAGSMRDRGSQMEEMLKLILDKHADTPKTLLPLRARIKNMVEALADVLVESVSTVDLNKVDCAKALDIFVAASPSALAVQKADALLPYLTVSANAPPDDLAVREHLLRIFHVAVPSMQVTALAFATKLEGILLTMLKRPPMQQASLEELVGSLCVTVQCHTRSYDKLAGLFKQYLNTAKAMAENAIKSSAKDERAVMSVSLLARVVSLLCEHADFDRLRAESEQAIAAVDSISAQSIARLTFDWLMSLYLQDSVAELRSNAMLCLGFLFRSFPSMMLEPAATKMMDDVFAQIGGDVEEQARLLGVIRDFLTQQAEKNSDMAQSPSALKKPKVIEVDMKELIGNTDSFADSGVSSAIVQRYLSHILQAAQSVDPAAKMPAVDILGFTVRQGLAHPLESLRVIVALETGPDLSIAKRMVALHSTLHSKHADLVHARFLESARASFDYLSKLSSRDYLRGYRTSPTTALFEPWYGLLKEKRKWKLDFLKGLLRAFVVDPNGGKCVQTDIDFGRYVAENLATLEYKTMEEVFACIAGLDRLLGDTGIVAGHLLEERLDAAAAIEAGEEDENVEAQCASSCVLGGNASSKQRTATESSTFASLVRASQLLSMALMLRDHLKALYKVTDAKLSKYTPGKKSPAGDKAAVRQDDAHVTLVYDALPLAVRMLVDNSPEMAQHAKQYTESIAAETSGADGDDVDE